LQKNDEKMRVQLTKNELNVIINKIQVASPPFNELWHAVDQIFILVDHAVDYNILIDKFKTGNAIPADFNFSDTSDDTKRKALLKTINPDISKQEPELEQLIINMGAENIKKARKAAVERVKILDKETIEVQKQRQAYDVLCNSVFLI
jgi:hypothetical protein